MNKGCPLRVGTLCDFCHWEIQAEAHKGKIRASLENAHVTHSIGHPASAVAPSSSCKESVKTEPILNPLWPSLASQKGISLSFPGGQSALQTSTASGSQQDTECNTEPSNLTCTYKQVKLFICPLHCQPCAGLFLLAYYIDA